MYDPKGTDSGQTDWIELYNPTDKKITIKKEDFGLIDEKELKIGSDGKHYLNCHKIKKDLEIDAGEYLVIADDNKEFLNSYPDYLDDKILDSTFSLSSDGDTIHFSDDKCETFFAEISYEDSWGGKNNGKTLEKIDFDRGDLKSNWQESYVYGGTPGKKSSQRKEYSKEIRLNELLPNPSGAEKENEFIELYNFGEKEIDLADWSIEDYKKSEKTGKETKHNFVFEKDFCSKRIDKCVIKSNKFFVVESKNYSSAGLTLNNSGIETIYLLDPNGEAVSGLQYSGGRENISISFDGKKWRWSSKLTKGKENKFDAVPDVRIKKDSKVYKDTYASFTAEIKKAKEKDLKFVWDFGDGHKSYLQETRHKYEKEGKYVVSLKVSTKSESFIQDFTVEVKKFPRSNVEIVEFSANPRGRDTEAEWIVIQNNTKNKINLKGWSVATGLEILYNHPIREDFFIEFGETGKLTREICAFTLNNKKSRIELRYPNGKAASIIEYDKGGKSIAEDELGSKTESGWRWVGGIGNNENKPEAQDEIIPKEASLEESSQEFVGGQTIDNSGEENRNIIFNLGNEKLSKISDKIILDVETKRLNRQEEGSNKFIRKNLVKINLFLNKSINFLMS